VNRGRRASLVKHAKGANPARHANRVRPRVRRAVPSKAPWERRTRLAKALKVAAGADAVVAAVAAMERVGPTARTAQPIR
jgi:hypothetical protein